MSVYCTEQFPLPTETKVESGGSRVALFDQMRHVDPKIPCGTEAGSYLRLIDSCITQLKAQGPSRTCNESKEEEEVEEDDSLHPKSTRGLTKSYQSVEGVRPLCIRNTTRCTTDLSSKVNLPPRN